MDPSYSLWPTILQEEARKQGPFHWPTFLGSVQVASHSVAMGPPTEQCFCAPTSTQQQRFSILELSHKSCPAIAPKHCCFPSPTQYNIFETCHDTGSPAEVPSLGLVKRQVLIVWSRADCLSLKSIPKVIATSPPEPFPHRVLPTHHVLFSFLFLLLLFLVMHCRPLWL